MIGHEVDGPVGGWSEAVLGASVCGPWPLLGLLLAVLGCSCGLGVWSWVALRTSVGGPGPLSGPREVDGQHVVSLCLLFCIFG